MKNEDRMIITHTIQILSQEQSITFSREKEEKKKKNHL